MVSIIILTLVIIIIILGLGLYNLYNQLMGERISIYKLECILNSSNEAWYAWQKDKSFIACSNNFPKLFNLNENTPAKAIDVLAHLVAEDAARLTRHSKNLQYQDFEIEATLENGKRALFKGRGLADNNLFILWVKELNDEITIAKKMWQELKLAEQENKLLKSILNNIPYPMWAKGKENQLIYCNIVYARALECTVTSAINHNRSLEELPIYKSGLRNHLIKINGKQRVLNLQETKINHEESIGYANDISDILLSEEESRKYKQAHKEILNQLDQPIAVFGRDTKLEFFNKAYEKLYNLNPEWLKTGPTLGEILEEQRTKRLLPEYANFPAYKKEQIQNLISLREPIEELQHLPNERTLHLIISPYPLGGCLFIWEDITERLTLEQRYNNITSIQHETLSKLTEGVSICLDNGRITYANEAFNKLWEIEEEEYKKAKYWAKLLEATKEKWNRARECEEIKKEIIRAINSRENMKTKIKTRDEREIELAYYPLPGGCHLIRCKQADREADIEIGCKREIAQLLYKLRSALTTIAGFADMLRSNLQEERNQKQAENILRFAQRGLNYIRDILEIEAIRENKVMLNKKYFGIKGFSEQLIRRYEKEIEGKKIRVRIESEEEVMYGDEGKVGQSMGHLLLNAIRYSEEGGEIVVKGSKEAGRMQLIIENKGREEKIKGENIIMEGNGAGYLIKGIVRAHGGNIYIDNKGPNIHSVICEFPLP